MKKIALFLPWMEFGGAERVMLNLSQGLVAYGYEVHLVLARARGGLLEQVPSTVRVVDLGSDRIIASLPGLVRYLRNERPDVLLSGLPHANIIALWSKRLARIPIRVVISEHNVISKNLARSKRSKDIVIQLLLKLFYPWADSIVAVSEGVANDLLRFIRLPEGRVTVIHNPIIVPKLDPGSIEHPWFHPGQPPVIITAGRLTSQKDHQTLLRAFAILRKRRGAHLLLLGDGEQRPILEDLVEELKLTPDVQMPGFIEDPFHFFSGSAVFVLSSAWEGFGNVLVEALACGLQVVSTDCESGPAEILQYGKYGRLVPVGDANAMAAAIESALNDPLPRDELLERASQFSVEEISRQYLRVLFPNSKEY